MNYKNKLIILTTTKVITEMEERESIRLLSRALRLRLCPRQANLRWYCLHRSTANENAALFYNRQESRLQQGCLVLYALRYILDP